MVAGLTPGSFAHDVDLTIRLLAESEKAQKRLKYKGNSNIGKRK